MSQHKFYFRLSLWQLAAEIIEILQVPPFIFLQVLLSFLMVSLTCMPFFKLDNLLTEKQNKSKCLGFDKVPSLEVCK